MPRRGPPVSIIQVSSWGTFHDRRKQPPQNKNHVEDCGEVLKDKPRNHKSRSESSCNTRERKKEGEKQKKRKKTTTTNITVEIERK